MTFSFSRSSRQTRFRFSRPTTTKRADVDSRAFGIVVRRDVNLDVSGVGDGLADGETGTTKEKGDWIELHFG